MCSLSRQSTVEWGSGNTKKATSQGSPAKYPLCSHVDLPWFPCGSREGPRRGENVGGEMQERGDFRESPWPLWPEGVVRGRMG